MVRIVVILVCLVCVVSVAFPQVGATVEDATARLQVIIPEQEYVETDLPRYRISANTHPDAKAFINGRQVRVYPSGAFVGLVSLDHGENQITITAISAEGDTASKTFTIVRAKPLQTSPADPLTIEDVLMEPSRDYWLNAGDILEVQFKGSPGYDATFDIDGVVGRVPMRELPPSETGGVRGIYVGHYHVQPGDFAENVRVRFRLRRSFWSSIEFESPGVISILCDRFPLIGRVRGFYPVLNTSIGTDRLGGARFGFIEPGVLLQIDGKVGNLYRVRLADSKTAWIGAQFVELLSEDMVPPRTLAGSVSVSGTPAGDLVTVHLGEKLPYLSQQLVNPNRIVIDIFGASSNTTWLTQHRSAEGIESVTWEQVATEQYRLTIHLRHPVHWGHRIRYTDGGTMHVIVRRPPELQNSNNTLLGRVIGLDAGHGGENKGALGSTGAMEKDIALSITNIVRRMLIEQGAQVVMTRTGDYDLSMRSRIEKIHTANPDIVLSIHCNSIGYASDPERVRGTSTYYKHVGFKPLADIMYEQLLKLGFAEFGVIGSFNFLLNEITEVPNVLIETAFISNPEDEMKLIDPEMQEKIAEAIVEGVRTFFKRYLSHH